MCFSGIVCKCVLFPFSPISSFIGFDSVSTLAGEVKNPGRNLPIGIVGTLAIATVLYCAVAIVMTGMVRYDLTDKDAPLATAFHQIGYDTVAAIVGFVRERALLWFSYWHLTLFVNLNTPNRVLLQH